MKLAPGTDLGPYRVEAPIGAGGMGTVYRARDTRLDRTIAIKIVAGPFSERFEREAKTIASLNHPHICTVHDVGENYLVMEYVEGAPVSGPLPVNEVVRLGSQIAEALDAAHRKGITHRDLKPGNVLIAKSGVKVIDFGLAKAGPVIRGEFDVTMTKPLTAEGSILGTVAYMSPEQLQGQEADARSDIFALGCVLYEMLTGKRAFDGKSAVSVMAAILEHEPTPLSEVQPAAPAWLDRVIRRCLRKDPEARWQSARDVAIELREPPPATAAPAPASNKWPWIAAAALISALTTYAIVSYPPRQVAVPRPTPFEIAAGRVFDGTGGAGNYPEISPDGSRIAFNITTNGISRLYVRRLDSVEILPVPHSEGAAYGAFSPDSRSVAFRADDRLKKVDLQSGTVEILGEWPNAGSPFFAWSSHGILFGGRLGGGLTRLPASGGAGEVIIPGERNGGIIASMPSFLPDGRRFVFYSRTGPSGPGVYQGSIDAPGSKPPRFLFQSETTAKFAAAGKQAYLLFVRSQSLLAQPIDESSLASMSNPIPLISGFAAASLHLPVSAAKGILVYQNLQLNTPRRLVWFGRKGEDLGEAAPAALYQSINLSPDGNRAVVTQGSAGSFSGDIWILDLTRKTSSRLTLDGTSGRYAIWTANGQAVTFVRNRVFTMPAAGGEAVEVPIARIPFGGLPLHWSRTGNTLLFSQSGRYLWTYDADSKQTTQIFPEKIYNQTAGQFSPDGRWIAYASDESGSRQVYVTSYPPGNGKLTITSKGGSHPRWRADGLELYCISDGKLIAIPIRRAGAQIEAGSPQELFNFPSGGDTVNLFRYDVAANGQRFLVMLDPPDARREPIMVVLNWKPEAAGARP